MGGGRYKVSGRVQAIMELRIVESEMKGTWEEVVPGDDWKYIGEYVLTQEMNREITASVDDDNPWYVEDSPFGGPIANPAVLYVMAFVAVNKMCGIPPRPERPSAHAKQTCEFFKPAKIGKKVKIEGRIPQKYSKSGKDYLVLEARFTDEDNALLLLYRHTRVFQLASSSPRGEDRE